MDKKEYKKTLWFHFGLPYDEKNSEDFSRAFYKELGLKCYSGVWSYIELDSEIVDLFLKKLDEYKSSRKADFRGFCELGLMLANDAEHEYEWYEIRAQNNIYDFMNFTNIDSIEFHTVNAYKIPPTTHVGCGGFYNNYVSERFKNIVEQYKLTGIDFLWLKDTGKYKAKQWYIPIPKFPIGKGIDHQWFNPKTLRGSDSWQPVSKIFRTGMNIFYASQIKRKYYKRDPIIKAIIKHFLPSKLNFLTVNKLIKRLHWKTTPEYKTLKIISNLRYSPNYLPPTDFAFNWRQVDKIRDGVVRKQRGMCINKRTKRILLENNLLTLNDLVPIEIVYDINDNEFLDITGKYPEPLYTDAQIEKLRVTLETDYLKFLNTDKPLHEIKLNEALRILKRAKTNRPNDFNKGLRSTKETIPLIYREVLKITNGGLLGAEAILYPADKLDYINEEKNTLLEKYGSLESKYYHFGYSLSGDWYSINISENSEDYLAVVRFSHEVDDVIYTWKNMAFFIFDILSGFYK